MSFGPLLRISTPLSCVSSIVIQDNLQERPRRGCCYDAAVRTLDALCDKGVSLFASRDFIGERTVGNRRDLECLKGLAVMDSGWA
jgi:hypothetical protein